MTVKKVTKSDKKVAKRRMTPKDVENERVGKVVEREKKKPGRKPTKAEQHANNVSKVEFTKMVVSVKNLKPVFDAELAEMNRNKNGRPYKYSNSQILWIMALLTTASLTFRGAAGAAEAIMDLVGAEAPSYSRLFERARDIMDELIKANKKGSDDGILLMIACPNVVDRIRNLGLDSSGFNMSCANIWRSKKWGTKPVDRGWIKLHALSDVDTNEIVAYAITTESVGDSPLLKKLLALAISEGHKVGKVYADGAYSSVDNFDYVCGELKLEFVTSFRSNTVPKNNGSTHRGKAARLWCELPYDEWVRVSGYGRRWKCEVVFSDLKRLFRETITAKTIEGAVRQMVHRIENFNKYKALRTSIIESHVNSSA